jgi:hypothetical protein
MACFRKELWLLVMALCFSVVTSCGYPPWAWTPFNSSARPYQQVCKCLDDPANKPGRPFALSSIPGSVVFYGQRDYDDYITCQATLPAYKHCQWKILHCISLPIECGVVHLPHTCGASLSCTKEDHFMFSPAQIVCGPHCPSPTFSAGANTPLNVIFRSNRICSSTQMESIWIGYCEPLVSRRECRPEHSMDTFSSCPFTCGTSPQLCRYLCPKRDSVCNEVCYAVPRVDTKILTKIAQDMSGATARRYASSTHCILRDAARLALANIERYGRPVPILTLRRKGQGTNCTVLQGVC